MTGGGLARWDSPPGHPVVAVGHGSRAGAACGCGGWQAYMPDVEAALRARQSYEEHLRRAGLTRPGDTPDAPGAILLPSEG